MPVAKISVQGKCFGEKDLSSHKISEFISPNEFRMIILPPRLIIFLQTKSQQRLLHK